MLRVTNLLLLVFLVVAAGCSPHIQPTLDVPSIPRVEKMSPLASGQRAEVFINNFTDNRPSPAIAVLRDKESTLKVDPGDTVKAALIRALKEKGCNVSDNAALSLVGEIRKWYAEVKDGLPASVSTEASLHIQVFDPTNHKVFSGHYQGRASMERGSINSEDVRTALGSAMSEAIAQIVSDEQLLGILSSY